MEVGARALRLHRRAVAGVPRHLARVRARPRGLPHARRVARGGRGDGRPRRALVAANPSACADPRLDPACTGATGGPVCVRRRGRLSRLPTSRVPCADRATGEPQVGVTLGLVTRGRRAGCRSPRGRSSPSAKARTRSSSPSRTSPRSARPPPRSRAPTPSSSSSPTSPRMTSPSRCGWSRATSACCGGATTGVWIPTPTSSSTTRSTGPRACEALIEGLLAYSRAGRGEEPERVELCWSPPTCCGRWRRR